MKPSPIPDQCCTCMTLYMSRAFRAYVRHLLADLPRARVLLDKFSLVNKLERNRARLGQ